MPEFISKGALGDSYPPTMSRNLEHKSRARSYDLRLSELDLTVILEALGHKQTRSPSKATQILIDRIYRAMGVRL